MLSAVTLRGCGCAVTGGWSPPCTWKGYRNVCDLLRLISYCEAHERAERNADMAVYKNAELGWLPDDDPQIAGHILGNAYAFGRSDKRLKPLASRKQETELPSFV